MVSKQKILIVDDDNNIAELIALYLTKECFETKIVNDGEEALREFASFRPDLIILDPPRDGIHPKALDKIIDFGVDRMVYISCKPTSLTRDLVVLQERGYKLEKACAVDMFPSTANCETIGLLTRVK